MIGKKRGFPSKESFIPHYFQSLKHVFYQFIHATALLITFKRNAVFLKKRLHLFLYVNQNKDILIDSIAKESTSLDCLTGLLRR
jgi:hypothetical protein